MANYGDAYCDATFEAIFDKGSYVNLLLGPILGIVAVSYTITIFITFLRLFLWKKEWQFAKKFREADRKMVAYMLESFFNMLHHREGIRELEHQTVEPVDIKQSTGDYIKMEDKRVDSFMAETSGHNAQPTHNSMIDTDEILRSKWAMTILSWYVASVSSLALVVFWDAFILKDSNGCIDEDGIDCFYKKGTYINQFCSCLSNDDQFDAKCYEITLEFPMAIAEVAGILFLAFNGFTFLIFLKLLVADGVASACLRVLMYLLLAVIEYAIVLGITISFIARGVSLAKENSMNMIIEQVLISIALFMGVTTPWIMLLWALKRVMRKRKTVKSNVSRSKLTH